MIEENEEKRRSEEQTSSEGDSPDPGRRDAIFWLAAGGTALTGVASFGDTITSVTRGVFDIAETLESRSKSEALRRQHVREVFFSGLRGDVPMVPGVDQSVFRAPKQINPDDDIAAINSLIGLFERSEDYTIVEPKDALYSESGFICTGSPTTNYLSRLALDFSRVDGKAILLHTSEGNFALPFAHRTGSAATTLRRYLHGHVIEEPNHEIVDFERTRVHGSLISRYDKSPINGYLLFSKVPHPRFPGHSASIWAGNTGPATEAASLLFDSDSFLSLSVLEEMREFASVNPYFQALFVVEDITLVKEDGRHKPMSVRLAPDGLRAIKNLDI